MTKKILLAGYYGANNIGDDAILVSMIEAIKTIRTDIQFEVVSFDPSKTSRELRVTAIPWRDIPELTRAVSRADLVIIGGGGLFMDYWGLDENSYFRSIHGGISTYGTPARLAEAFSIPWMFYGVGVGPLFTEIAREHTRQLFSRVRLATLRDEDSMHLLRKIGLDPLPDHIHLTADPTFALKVSSENIRSAQGHCTRLEVDSNKPLLGVSIRYWDRPERPADWVPRLAKGLREFSLRTSTQILILPFQIGEEDMTDDLSVGRFLLKELDLSVGAHLVEERLPPLEMQALLGRCDLILGMRLHALVMGINEETPVVGLAYDPKVLSFMRRGGMEEWVTVMPFEVQTITELLERAWKNRKKLSILAQKYRNEMLPSAMENARLAMRLLDTPSKRPGIQSMVDFLVERLTQMQLMDENIRDLNVNVKNLENELDEAKSQVRLSHQHLIEIEKSRTYRLALRFQNMRNRLLPPGGLLETWLSTLLKRLDRS